MLSGKDISIDKDGNIILNGDKYPLASQAEIDAVKDDIDDIEEKLEKTFSLDAGTVIPNNSDLNDYKTPGNYYHLTADVGTISNIPISKGFKLTVLLDLKDAGFIEQLFNPIGTYTLYKRYLTSGQSWSNWEIVEDKLSDIVSVYQPANVEITVTGPYTDIAFTPPVEAGFTFYLIGAFATNLAGWNMSNINAVAGSIRVFTSDTSAVTSQVKTTWLKVKNA